MVSTTKKAETVVRTVFPICNELTLIPGDPSRDCQSRERKEKCNTIE